MGQSSTAKKRLPRDAVSKVAQQRLSVLELARELGSVAEACRQRGMDRTSFYEWKRRFQTQGFEGLKDLPPIHKSHPQTTPPETVEKIRALALEHPSFGCNRYEAMLALEGYHWPGNVRELKNVVERSVYRAGSAHIEAIVFDPFAGSSVAPPQRAAETGAQAAPEPSPAAAATPSIDEDRPFNDVVRELELRLLRRALQQCQFNQKKAAESLSLTYHQFRGLYRKYRDELGE